MGRHLKLAPPSTARVPDASEQLLDRTKAHLEHLLGAVEATLETGECTPALVRESAAVARAVTSLSAEMRQRERHIKYQLEELGDHDRDALVKAYVASLTPERRVSFLRYVDELSQADQLLS